jgi:hypothetical protein
VCHIRPDRGQAVSAMAIEGRIVSRPPQAHFLEFKRDTEQDNASQTLLNQRPKETFEPVNSPSLLTGKRLDLDFGIGIVGDEDRVHEHVLVQGPTSGLISPQERMMVASSED